eukprot:4402244-Pleurochrysis_carterae.AAC.1
MKEKPFCGVSYGATEHRLISTDVDRSELTRLFRSGADCSAYLSSALSAVYAQPASTVATYPKVHAALTGAPMKAAATEMVMTLFALPSSEDDTAPRQRTSLNVTSCSTKARSVPPSRYPSPLIEFLRAHATKGRISVRGQTRRRRRSCVGAMYWRSERGERDALSPLSSSAEKTTPAAPARVESDARAMPKTMPGSE